MRLLLKSLVFMNAVIQFICIVLFGSFLEYSSLYCAERTIMNDSYKKDLIYDIQAM